MAKVCIVCKAEVQGGHRVEDDAVIRAIRSAKRRFNIAKNNDLVVCAGCLEEYRKKRAAYERDLAIHVVIAAIVLLVTVVLPVFTSGFSLMAVAMGVFLAGMVMALSVFSHWPKIAEAHAPAAKAGARKTHAKTPAAKKHGRKK